MEFHNASPSGLGVFLLFQVNDQQYNVKVHVAEAYATSFFQAETKELLMAGQLAETLNFDRPTFSTDSQILAKEVGGRKLDHPLVHGCATNNCQLSSHDQQIAFLGLQYEQGFQQSCSRMCASGAQAFLESTFLHLYQLSTQPCNFCFAKFLYPGHCTCYSSMQLRWNEIGTPLFIQKEKQDAL